MYFFHVLFKRQRWRRRQRPMHTSASIYTRKKATLKKKTLKIIEIFEIELAGQRQR